MAPRSQPTDSAAMRKKKRRPEPQSGSESDRQSSEAESEHHGPTQRTREGGGPSTQTQKGGLGENELKSKAAQLVRFALFSEYKRQILRRDTIVKEILSKSPRAFPMVLAKAQTILRQTFGMELAEVRAKGKGEGVLINGDGSLAAIAPKNAQKNGNGNGKGKGRARLEDVQEEDEDEDAEGSGQPDQSTEISQTQANAVSTGTKSYILRSILPQAMIMAMSTPSSLSLLNGHPLNEGNIYEPEDTVDSGALLRLEKADGSSTGGMGLLGVKTVILCLMLCLGRVVKDDHLHALLKRIHLERETVLPQPSTDTKEPVLTLDKFMDRLAAQNYIEKIKVPGNDQSALEWRWGNREVEFSEVAAAAFIEKIFFTGEDEDESSEEGEGDGDGEEANGRGHRNGRSGLPRHSGDRRRRRDRASEKEKARKKLKLDIAKAAGSELVGSL